MMNSNLCLPNIGEPYELNLTLYEATLVPGFYTLKETRDYLRITRHWERFGTLDFPSSIEMTRQFSRSQRVEIEDFTFISTHYENFDTTFLKRQSCRMISFSF
jgi:hypothetical protein